MLIQGAGAGVLGVAGRCWVFGVGCWVLGVRGSGVDIHRVISVELISLPKADVPLGICQRLFFFLIGDLNTCACKLYFYHTYFDT